MWSDGGKAWWQSQLIYTHTYRNAHAYTTYIHTAHKRLPLKHASVKLDEVPLSISKPTWKCRLVIPDASRASRKFSRESHRSRNVRPASHFQTIFSDAVVKKQRGIFLVCVKTGEPNYSSPLPTKKAYSLATLNPAVLSVPNPNYPTVLETWYSWEGGKKIQLTSMKQKQHLRDFYREEEIAGLIVLGSCPWSPDGFVNHVNTSTDEGQTEPFRRAAVRTPLIIWSGPDCRRAGGRYIRQVWGQNRSN